MKFNNTKYKALHLHQSNPQYEYTLENELIESSPVEKDVAILVKKNIRYELCFPSSESQLCPNLHQKMCHQQGKGGGFAPRLSSHETPARVLQPPLGSVAQKDINLWD